MDKNYIAIVFDGPPSHESGRFVEVNDSHGKSIDIGTWVSRGDGSWELRIAVDKLKEESMTVDTSREAVEALIAEAEEFTNPTVGYAFKSDYDHNQTVPLLDSLRHALAALLDERDALQKMIDVVQKNLASRNVRIRDLEATNRKISERSTNHHNNAIKWRERAERAEADLHIEMAELFDTQAERDKLTARMERLSRMQPIYDAAQTVKGTGGAVEIGGVRIEPCDEFGATETTRERDKLAAKLDAVKAVVTGWNGFTGLTREVLAILADTDEGNEQ